MENQKQTYKASSGFHVENGIAPKSNGPGWVNVKTGKSSPPPWNPNASRQVGRNDKPVSDNYAERPTVFCRQPENPQAPQAVSSREGVGPSKTENQRNQALRDSFSKILGDKIRPRWEGSKLHERWNDPSYPEQRKTDLKALGIVLAGISGVILTGVGVHSLYEASFGDPSWRQNLGGDIHNGVFNVRNAPGFFLGAWRSWERAKTRDKSAAAENKSWYKRFGEVIPMSLETAWDVTLYTIAGRVALERLWPSGVDYLSNPINIVKSFIENSEQYVLPNFNEGIIQIFNAFVGTLERGFALVTHNETYKPLIKNVDLFPALRLIAQTLGIGWLTHKRDKIQQISNSSVSKVTRFVNPIESIISPISMGVNLARDSLATLIPLFVNRRGQKKS